MESLIMPHILNTVFRAAFLLPMSVIAFLTLVQSGNASANQSLYTSNCSSCHGSAPNITGGARNGANNPTRISNAINGGVNQMSFLNFLTPTNIADIAAYIGSVLAPPVVLPDYTGAWFKASESGWGLSVIRGASGLYGIIMYNFNQTSNPTWYFMAGGSFSGTVYNAQVTRYSGPYFGSPFNSVPVTSTPVGSATIIFTSATTATLTYTIDNVTVTKDITKLEF